MHTSCPDKGGFVLRRIGSSSGPLRVNFLLSGTAINGGDYVGDVELQSAVPLFADFRNGQEEIIVRSFARITSYQYVSQLP